MRRRAGGEKARRGIGMDADSFSSGQEPRRKARNPHAYLEGVARKAPHPGCPFFGLLFFGQAKKSDSASGRRAKRPLRKRPDRRHATTKRYRYWIPTCAGMTAKDETLRRAPAPHPNPLPEGEREQNIQASRPLAKQPNHRPYINRKQQQPITPSRETTHVQSTSGESHSYPHQSHKASHRAASDPPGTR